MHWADGTPWHGVACERLGGGTFAGNAVSSLANGAEIVGGSMPQPHEGNPASSAGRPLHIRDGFVVGTGIGTGIGLLILELPRFEMDTCLLPCPNRALVRAKRKWRRICVSSFESPVSQGTPSSAA